MVHLEAASDLYRLYEELPKKKIQLKYTQMKYGAFIILSSSGSCLTVNDSPPISFDGFADSSVDFDAVTFAAGMTLSKSSS